MLLKVCGDREREGAQQEVPPPGMLWKGRRESQSQAEVTGGPASIPEDFTSEGKLSGSSGSFSIHVEDDSCQAPFQNHLCRGKQLKFQRLQHQEGASFL